MIERKRKALKDSAKRAERELDRAKSAYEESGTQMHR
jgi:hypothetical protein